MEAATRHVGRTHGVDAVAEERARLRELSATYADDVNALATHLRLGITKVQAFSIMGNHWA